MEPYLRILYKQALLIESRTEYEPGYLYKIGDHEDARICFIFLLNYATNIADRRIQMQRIADVLCKTNVLCQIC